MEFFAGLFTLGLVSELDFRFDRGGLYFPALRLWMDAPKAVGEEAGVFVSHAHADHTGAHAAVLFSLPTRKLMRARVAGRRTEHALEFGVSHPLSAFAPHLSHREARITLLPAGHILGSAMAFLEVNGSSLLYTGDFKLRSGLSSEVCQPCKADILIMETTFGRPEYVFPPCAQVVESIVAFCRDTLKTGGTPVLLGYSLGKAQEILRGLLGTDLPVSLSSPMMRLTRIYESFGHVFPPYEEWDGEDLSSRVLLVPPGPSVKRVRTKVAHSRLALISGWALRSGYQFRAGADAAFPLSDHADFPELIEFVRRVAPRKIYTLHGFAADFAGCLRDSGWDAEPLSGGAQMEMQLPGSWIPSPRGITT